MVATRNNDFSLKAVSKREEKSSSFVGSGFGPDAAAVAGDDFVDGGETDASPFKFRSVVQSLERTEQLGRVVHVESSPVVANEKEGSRLVAIAPKRNLCLWLFGCELPSVPEQILKHNHDQLSVSHHQHPL